jgi:DNA polymerase-3 subunit delta'
MSLPPLAGHHELRDRMRRASARGRLPQSLLFHGPEGVGKQRLGLWLGALLLCTGEVPEQERPCGDCRSCRLAGRLEHPDLHWYFPLRRPTGTSSREKLREKLEEARMEELDRIREEPLVPSDEEKATGIYLAAVEEMRSKASRRPAMGPGSVFVVGDAEAMVPQAASPQAANAFLKLLEEPPEDTHIVLTSSRREALLSTVRSRVMSVRVPPLAEEEVEAFLREEAAVEAEEARTAARRSQGSIGRALRELTGEGRELQEEAEAFVRAALSRRPVDRWEYATTVSPSGARGEYSDLLARVAELLRDLLALSLDRADASVQRERARELAGDRELAPHGLVSALERLEEARGEAQGNVNPQAITAELLPRMARDLAG